MPLDDRTHTPNWETGKCRTCTRPWPCITQQVLLECHFAGSPKSLRAHMERTASQVDPAYRDQIIGWLEGP